MCLSDYMQCCVFSLLLWGKKKRKSEVHKTSAFFSAMTHVKTIKPVESNLEDLGFPEIPGKSEPGSQHGVKRRGCLDR